MKKFLLGMMFAHYLSLIGRSEFFRAVVLGVTKNLKKLEEETRPEPSVSEQRTKLAEDTRRVSRETIQEILAMHRHYHSISTIAGRTGLLESTVRHILNTNR